MYIKQISIFIENLQGRLADILEDIAKSGIDIRALSLADTTNFGILRLIVDKPHEAEKVLRQAGYTVSLTAVIAIEIDDTPGSLAKALRVLSDNNISIEYLYAFISKKKGCASVILRVDDGDKAVGVLDGNGAVFLSDRDIEES